MVNNINNNENPIIYSVSSFSFAPQQQNRNVESDTSIIQRVQSLFPSVTSIFSGVRRIFGNPFASNQTRSPSPSLDMDYKHSTPQENIEVNTDPHLASDTEESEEVASTSPTQAPAVRCGNSTDPITTTTMATDIDWNNLQRPTYYYGNSPSSCAVTSLSTSMLSTGSSSSTTPSPFPSFFISSPSSTSTITRPPCVVPEASYMELRDNIPRTKTRVYYRPELAGTYRYFPPAQRLPLNCR